MKSTQVVTGIDHHTKFENDVLKTVDARLQTNRQVEPNTYFLPLWEEKKII